jgi:glutamate dehydrogenase (NAD(P)+)
MAWVKDEIGRAVGLPREVGGIPLDEIGATGFGVAIAAEVAATFCDLELPGARVVVQGFGAVGIHAARFLAERGAVLVAASDSKGAVCDPHGLDVERLVAHKRTEGNVSEYPAGRRLERDAVIEVACEIWIPAARPDVIRDDNAARMNTRMIVSGANIPATSGAERILHERGVLMVPDFIANAGGVICAAVEYHGGSEAQVFATIDEKIRRNTRAVLEGSQRRKALPREAAVDLAMERVRRAMATRRWSTG